jgi:transposase
MRWTPPAGAIRHQCAKLYVVHQLVQQEGPVMDATTVGIDLAKNVFEIALADERGHTVERQRLSRARFDRFFANRPACRIVMEACGSAHHHARRLSSQGHSVVLLPAQYARAYVRRNKTDAADAAALIEASRCPDIRPVPIKSVDQQALQQLHRLRSQWMGARTSRINFLRSCLREFGVGVPVGAKRAIQAVRDALSSGSTVVPTLLHSSLLESLVEIEALEQRCQQIDRDLALLNGDDPVVERLLQIPGVGPLTATALRASVVDIQRFPSGRHFASWLGLTSREHSSGERRRLGRISKQGDPYLRTLLIHGARAVLLAARSAQRRGSSLDRLRTWALDLQERRGHNKTAVALANKLARIVWATWRFERDFCSTP